METGPSLCGFLSVFIFALSISLMISAASETSEVRLITLDPGHFHAGLVQKLMYPQVSPIVHVYAPQGPDLQEHLRLIESFNTRANNPTHWQEKVYSGSDFVDRMVSEHAGNVVVLAGNNAHKTEYIDRSIRAGFNVLADKPMAITPEGFALLRKDFDEATKKKVSLYDIMTERFEITTILQRELSQMPEVFGTLQKGSAEQPAVVMESVHHYFKEVAGKALTRPAWFFDVRQQGEAINDVGTHLVDLVQWECFPDQAINWRKDIKVQKATRWPTELTPAQFKRVTGLEQYPEFLRADVDRAGNLNVFQNGDVAYTIRGVHAKVTALWRFEAPPGAKDTHHSILRGTRATLRIEQGPEQNFEVRLYVDNVSGAPANEFEKTLRAAVDKLRGTWSGLDVKAAGQSWQIEVPQKYAVGHEAHFAQVTENFLRYLAGGKMPAWEVPNMIAKYYVTTKAYQLSHGKN